MENPQYDSIQNNTRWKFKLREDMPPGFIENDRFPELPELATYLTPHNNGGYDSVGDFTRDVLNRAPIHLKNDWRGKEEIIGGLSLRYYSKEKPPFYVICTMISFSRAPPGHCGHCDFGFV